VLCCVKHLRAAARRTFRVALSIAALLALESACTTARPVLEVFFDGVPAEGVLPQSVAVVHQTRRPTYKAPEVHSVVITGQEFKEEVDWAARYAALPRNDAGDVAWTKALEDKVIEPKPGLTDDVKEEEPTDLDLEYVPEGQPEYKVIFPHKPHTQWMGCPSCHESGLFEMEKGKAKMTMASLGEGQYCGACHGKVASPDLNGCPTCHTAMGK
jgi:c(7)-type cytochrome triheme protein